MAHEQLDSLDYRILRTLSENARKPYLEIARECGVSGAAIHQRIQKLTSLGVIAGTQSLIKPSTVGFDSCAYIGFYLNNPNEVDQLISKLKEIPEVVECNITTGKYDLLIKVFAKSNDHLLQIIHAKISKLASMRTETLISFKEVFKRQIPIQQEED